MKVTSLCIKNFKLFSELRTFKFSNTSIIVGNNGVGKSTILEALNLALTGYYQGKNILKILNQDIFNKNCVDAYLASLKTEEKQDPPKIEISVYFDSFAECNGDDTPDGSTGDGFTFYIEFDEKYKEAYSTMIKNNEIDSLPIEYYQIRWRSFARRDYYNNRFIGLKGLMIDSDNFSSNNLYTSKIIKEFFDDDASVKMSQAQRKVFDNLVNNDTVNKINEKILENQELKDKNVSLGVLSVSKTSWENLISTKVNEIPFEHIGKGEQCVIKTYLSFTNQSTKNKGIIMIEEPECHLAYGNLNKLLSFIKTKLSEFQVIITTHSSFVLNKLGLNNLLLISCTNCISFEDISDDTTEFFEKKSGYDTLRFLLCDKSILVEGDSDELIIQRAYKDKYGKLPIDDGIDIISVGLSFLRFLEIAKQLNLTTCIVTDNDGNVEALKGKYKDYCDLPNIEICYSKTIVKHSDTNISKDSVPNLNTLEPELLRANSLAIFNNIMNKTYSTEEDLLHYMIKNKTDVAWKIFKSTEKINYPQYILDSIGVYNEK